MSDELYDIISRARRDFASHANKSVYKIWRERFDPDPRATQADMREAMAYREHLYRQQQQQHTEAQRETQKQAAKQKRTAHEERLRSMEAQAQAIKHTKSARSQQTPSGETPSAAQSGVRAPPAASQSSGAPRAGVSFQSQAASD
jgi:hypothetical protein